MLTDFELMQKAIGSLPMAYAPYSGFSVGAALLCADGEVFCGVNVENASYGATLCAERVAVARAVCAGKRAFVAIAIAASRAAACPPCGICRQVLREFSPGLRVLGRTPEGGLVSWTLSELLPHSFGPDFL